MNKKKLILMGILVIIISILVFNNIRGKKENNDLSSFENDLGIAVELMTVSRADLVEDINYIGSILPKKSITVSPNIGGQIVDIYVEEGDLVESGELLAKINDSQLHASYITIEKKLESLKLNKNYLASEIENFHSTSPLVKKQDTLKSNYEHIRGEAEKYKKLYREGGIAEVEYEKIKQEEKTISLQLAELEATANDAYNKLKHERDMVEGQINEVNSSINEMENKIGDSLIKAPRKGIIKKIYYEEGELAGMGMPFVDIDDNEELLVNLNITESDLNKIELGDKAILNIKSFKNEIITSVSKINPNINPSTRIGSIEIGPIKAEEGVSLISGNSADTRIIINEVKDKLIIPKSTIKTLNDEKIVYLYKDGIVKERKITTGLTVGEMTEVVEGLKEGDKIVSKNLSKLYENAKVYIFKGAEK